MKPYVSLPYKFEADALIEHMDAVSSHRIQDSREGVEEEEWQGRAGSLSHRSAFCGMCRLIMLKANNNNNKSNKWLQLSMRQKRRQARRMRMVIDTMQRVALALPTPWFIWSSLTVPLGNLYRQLTDNCFQCAFSASFQCGKANKSWQENCQRSEPDDDDDDDDDAHRHNVTNGQCAVEPQRDLYQHVMLKSSLATCLQTKQPLLARAVCHNTHHRTHNTHHTRLMIINMQRKSENCRRGLSNCQTTRGELSSIRCDATRPGQVQVSGSKSAPQ